MYNALKHAHSGFRWLVLALLVYAVINAFMKWRNGSSYVEADKKAGLFAMVFFHIQFLIGLVLFFISPLVSFADGFMKNSATRFFTMEHTVMMLIAMALITIGYSKSKKQDNPSLKFKTTFIFYAIALLVVLLAIPWPFRGLGAGWF